MRFQLSIIINFFILCVTTTQLASKYEGVSWNEKRNLWQAEFHINGKKQKSYFNNEFDATKKLKKLCETMEIPSQNPTISTIPNQQKKEKNSQYKGVYWQQQTGKWYVKIYPNGQKQKYGGRFNDELNAAKKVNQLCEELGIPQQNPTISAIPNQQYQQKEKTSQYKGVTLHKKCGKWQVQVAVKGEKTKPGGYFKDELDAAKRVNQICEELGIPPQNPAISAMPNEKYQKIEKTSLYKGVSWHRERKKWRVQLCLKGEKIKSGGYFNAELDAAKRVNQFCEELGIPPQNPTISGIPNQQYRKKEKTSQYKGVTWYKQRKKWCARLSIKGEESKYGGMFKDELDAAKSVNKLCEEFGIPSHNPTIGAISNEQYQKKDKTSQFRGVTRHRDGKKWCVRLCIKGEKAKYGGYFNNELDAGKRVNQICEELKIAPQNPTISAVPNEQYQKREKMSQYKGVYWHKRSEKWYTHLSMKGEKLRHGGVFTDELDAAKNVNQLCEEFGIPLKNHGIVKMPTQQSSKTKSKVHQYKTANIVNKEVKIEDVYILDRFKDECEKRFLQSNDEKRYIATEFQNLNAKRKRKENSIMDDDVKEEKEENELLEKIQQDYTKMQD